MNALLLALVMQAPALPLDALTHPAKQVREEAIDRVAAGPLATTDLSPHLDHADSRVARAVIAVFRKRLAEDALPVLVRCGAHDDNARAEEAVRAAVAIALHHQHDVEALAGPDMPALSARIQRAIDADIDAHLTRVRGPGHTDKPQQYRRFLAGGRYAARKLEAVARDPGRVEHVRDHAVHALAIMLGRPVEKTLLDLFEDPAPRVRIACCSLIYQFASRPANRRLARRLDSVRMHQEYELAWIVAAVERTGELSDAGAQKLDRLVREGATNRALGASAALKRTRPKLFLRVLRARIEGLLARETQHAEAAGETALFQFRVGPLEEDLLARMRRSPNPLVCGAATVDREAALRVLAPVIAPTRAVGAREPLRLRVVGRLLVRHDAPETDRVRFAATALNSQLAPSRRNGLRALLGTSPAARAALEPRLRALLDDRYESVRLGAARLLAPEPKALETAILALYDGSAGAARAMREIARQHRPEWPAVKAEGDRRERRRQARVLLRLHKSERRGNE